MKSTTSISIVAIITGSLFSGQTLAQEAGKRTEFSRIDIIGSPNMEVISSISEYEPGEILRPHFHHGVESGYFVQGGKIQFFGKDPITVPAGTPIINERGVQHGGFTVVGETSLKIYTVHIVDKGKPLYDWIEK